MSFDWREYLNLALFLQRQRNSFTQEAAYRCAVSRAYYAAFCYARNYARDRQGYSPKYAGEDHQFVRNHFRDRGMVKIARMLDRLRHWRNSCDYDDSVPNISSIIKKAINDAQQIINLLT